MKNTLLRHLMLFAVAAGLLFAAQGVKAQGVFNPEKNTVFQTELITFSTTPSSSPRTGVITVTNYVGLELSETSLSGESLVTYQIQAPVAWIQDYRNPRLLRVGQVMVVSWMIKSNGYWSLQVYSISPGGDVGQVVVPATATGQEPAQWQVVGTRSTLSYITQWRSEGKDHLAMQTLMDVGRSQFVSQPFNLLAEIEVAHSAEFAPFTVLVHGDTLGLQWVISSEEEYELVYAQGGMELPIPIISKVAKLSVPYGGETSTEPVLFEPRLVAAGADEVFGLWEDEAKIYWVPLHGPGQIRSMFKADGFSLDLMEERLSALSN